MKHSLVIASVTGRAGQVVLERHTNDDGQYQGHSVRWTTPEGLGLKVGFSDISQATDCLLRVSRHL